MIPPNTPDFFNYIGIPYAEKPGDTGLNCWQLCEKIMVEVFDVVPPKYHYGGNYADVAPVFCAALDAWDQVPFEHRSVGDVVLLRMAGYPIHLGILVEPNKMIHTLKRVGSMLEDITSIKWNRRVEGVFRWRP